MCDDWCNIHRCHYNECLVIVMYFSRVCAWVLLILLLLPLINVLNITQIWNHTLSFSVLLVQHMTKWELCMWENILSYTQKTNH